MSTLELKYPTTIDPRTLYASPCALAIDGRLSRAERLRLLRRWEEQALDEELAVAEGMSGPPTDIADVRRALARLEEAPAARSPHAGRRRAREG